MTNMDENWDIWKKNKQCASGQQTNSIFQETVLLSVSVDFHEIVYVLQLQNLPPYVRICYFVDSVNAITSAFCCGGQW